MKSNTAKVINLEDYIRVRSPLKMDEAATILAFIEHELPNVEEIITDLALKKHKLKKIEPWQDKTLRFELALRRVSRFLEEKAKETANTNQRDAHQELAKQCASLISWNKELSAIAEKDAKKCADNEKNNAVDLMKVAGFLIGTPVGIQKVVEAFITSEPSVLKASGEAGLVLGGYLAFFKQINSAATRAANKMAELPKQVKIVHRSVRNAAVAITMTASVASKRLSDIEPREPARLAQRPRMAIVAKM
jgi:uncharacterized protein YukE